MSVDERVAVQLELRGSKAFQAEAAATAGSIRSLERESWRLAHTFDHAGGRGFWFNQALFTIRRTLYQVTIAMGVVAAASAAMGFQFNMVMEENTMAFTRFLGSAEAAEQELDYLFELAAATPFEFPQLTKAVRDLLAFNFSLEEANKLVAGIGDAVAAFGGGAEEIDRAVLALGQMLSTGRVLGQELRQLQQLGFINPEDFMMRTGISREQWAHIGELNMPSKVAIDAITAYWEERFGGAAEDFQKTMRGRLTTLRDYGGQMFGAMIEPLYARLRDDLLPQMIEVFQAGAESLRNGGSMTDFWEVVDQKIDSVDGLADAWGHLVDISEDFRSILRSTTDIVIFAFKTLDIGKSTLIALSVLLSFIAFILETFEPILKVLVTLWIAERTAIMLLTIWGWRMNAMNLFRLALTKRLVYWNTIMLVWELRMLILTNLRVKALWLLVTVYRVMVIWSKVLAAATIRVGIAFLIAFGWVGIIVLAVLALIGVLVLAYYKWDWFHDRVDSLFAFIVDHQAIIKNALIFAFSPLLLILMNIEKLIDAIKWVEEHASKVRLPGFLQDALKNMLPPGVGAGFGALGNLGGAGGAAVVGERGPRMSMLSPNALMMPQDLAFAGGQGLPPFNLKVYLDGRELAENVSRHRADAEWQQ